MPLSNQTSDGHDAKVQGWDPKISKVAFPIYEGVQIHSNILVLKCASSQPCRINIKLIADLQFNIMYK